MIPVEKNGAIVFNRKDGDGTEFIDIAYKGFKSEFEKSSLSDSEIEAFKNGILTATESIFERLPELEANRGDIKSIKFEDLFPHDDLLNQYLIPKRNRQGFLMNNRYPCSLPKSEGGRIVSVAINSEGKYITIPVASEDFSFHFNEN